VVVAIPAYPSYGCGGYAGAVVGAPPVAAAPSAPAAGGLAMPLADPGLMPKSDAEKDAVRKVLENLRKEDKSKGSLTPSQPATARITVNLPADARLWVDQVECPLTSEVRAFNTPVLQPGQTYFYTFKAQLERNGEMVTDSQRVLMTAGQNVTVNFSNLGTIATTKR
jgi:uncharacterized protein (TIGR03000 family)